MPVVVQIAEKIWIKYYVWKISWFTVVISDSVLQWKPIFLTTLK